MFGLRKSGDPVAVANLKSRTWRSVSKTCGRGLQKQSWSMRKRRDAKCCSLAMTTQMRLFAPAGAFVPRPIRPTPCATPSPNWSHSTMRRKAGLPPHVTKWRDVRPQP